MSKRVLQGVVVSDKADKTIVVRVERRIMHPLYKKFISKSKRFSAHDAENRCKVGDIVRIQECPPISKSKSFKVIYDDAEVAGAK
jgi:small subunit ribosomal protein S17